MTNSFTSCTSSLICLSVWDRLQHTECIGCRSQMQGSNRTRFPGQDLRTGQSPTEAQTPQPPKVLGSVLGEVQARNGVLEELLGKVLVLLVPRKDTKDKHFSKHFPEHPVSGQQLPEHSPEHFWGVGGVCAFVGGRPVRKPRFTTLVSRGRCELPAISRLTRKIGSG